MFLHASRSSRNPSDQNEAVGELGDRRPASDSWRRVGDVVADVIESLAAADGVLLSHAATARRTRIERLIVHLHALGPRVLGEFLDEIARRHRIATSIEERLEVFGSIDPAAVRSLGADQFPPSPIRVAGGTD